MSTAKVYAKIDAEGRIVRIEGGVTESLVSDGPEWILLDQGEGDRYWFCQNNYLDQSILIQPGVYRYKLADNKVTECSPEEIARQKEQYTAIPTWEDTMEAQIMYTALITDTLLEV